MSQKAFTLVEMLSICVIVGILAAFLFPVASAAVRRAHVSSDLNRLHQLQLAFAIYQSDWGGGGGYGKASSMGLPDSDVLDKGAWRAVLPDEKAWKSACGVHPDYKPLADRVVHFVYPPCNQEVGCGDYYEKYRDNSMLLIDVQCVDPDVRLESPYSRKLGGC